MYSTSVISHPTISNVNNAKDQNREMSGIPGADVDDAGGKSAGHLVTSTSSSDNSNKISSNDDVTASAASK